MVIVGVESVAGESPKVMVGSDGIRTVGQEYLTILLASDRGGAGC